MRLSEQEYHRFLRIHPALMHYVGLKEKLIPKGTSIAAFMNGPTLNKLPVRERLYNNMAYVDQFVRENPARLSAEDLEITKGFNHFLWGKINARSHKKAIKELGIKGYHFAIYNNAILASGKTKAEVEKQLSAMLKKKDLEAIFIFKV